MQVNVKKYWGNRLIIINLEGGKRPQYKHVEETVLRI